MAKREDFISWDEFFMGAAMLCAERSKDPNTQVGACIVNDENRILSVGYNGFPAGCDDDVFPWDRTGNDSYDTKYLYVCHAELNAILNCRGRNLAGSRIYVALFPCNECAKAIIQSGISEVVYLSDKYCGTDDNVASKLLFDSCGVSYRQINSKEQKIIRLSLRPDEGIEYLEK